MGLHIATLAAHGRRAEPPDAIPAAEPLYQTSVFDFDTIEASEPALAGERGYVYARYGLPNARTLEQTVAGLEGAEDALATSSGMAAIACGLLAVVSAGDRVIVQEDAYGGTLALLGDLARLGVTVETASVYDPAALAAAIERPARAVLVETISNPLVREVNVRALAAACRRAGAALFVDNTFATPVLARPLEDGADAVLHSATKFLGGHHDLCAGLLCGRADIVAAARGVAKRFGAVAAPFDAWLAVRGVKTLALRVERGQANARDLATRLRADRRVRTVHYPDRGAMLSFEVADARRLAAALRLITVTPSLGGVTTTILHPATASHRNLSPERRAALGITDGLLRLSVGIEAVDDVWADLDAALSS